MARRNEYFPQSVPHPGIDLAEKLEELGMGPKEFAVRTGKPEKTIAAILSGNSAITPDMAVLFENALSIPAHFWLNRQLAYDEYIARKKWNAIVAESNDWAKHFPVADMIQKNWLPDLKDTISKTGALLSFFGFSSHAAWEEYYFNQQLKVAFRISLAQVKEPYAVSAWLRMGEIQAASLSAGMYVEKDFKAALSEIKTLMARHPKNFFNQLQQVCLKTGVKLVYTPCLPKAPISGGTRWLNNTPLIQMTGRYKKNDRFWFTFFHEAGHILLHGKKDIFLEGADDNLRDVLKENEADEFAIKWTLTAAEEATIVEALPLSDAKIKQFAAEFNTHPAIIIGRLQHKQILPYSYGSKYFISVDLC